MYHSLAEKMQQSLAQLFTGEGILASSRDEVFGCIFGRDTAITVLKLLRVYEINGNAELLHMAKRSLETLLGLQGTVVNIETGEEPGKFIHEFREDNYEHLLKAAKPWFLSADKKMRNYDSVDATPLALIALYRYWEITKDDAFIELYLPSIKRGIEWLFFYGDQDGDGLLEFSLHPERRFGGLAIHSWTDSIESFEKPDKTLPPYPIAPVEVQGFLWLTLKLWENYFLPRDRVLAAKLQDGATKTKRTFGEKFMVNDLGFDYAAQGLDGRKEQIKTITANPLVCLWSAYKNNGMAESIFEERYVRSLVERGFREDLFDPDAGIRTMSVLSPTYNPNRDSYHNGSFWPMQNGLIYEGLLNFGFTEEALYLKQAALKAITYFDCPIELYHKNGNGYSEYLSPSGQKSCREQAWSAAAILEMAIS